ncbi:hypothetical protein J3459_010360 [Metarhizium acridum]|uniref:uncharacterized protein n=1 Tax=Metarhizium acridum TaxID=92637 RepID=UPI001C6C4391|nr:hypothetical protein J3459_018434 [Metarhizium acridum]KAG8409764.1 hypothetical protein J3458_018846 [Metarhizium acridum]KAG8422470.1 hypothetical protein J3459_010360 [Metarhizium acridum]
MTVKSLGIRVSIDRGGTFTDAHAAIPQRQDIILKLLSVDPANYQDAPTEGIRRTLELVTGQKLPRGEPLDLFHFESICMGTTVATNALLERKGEKVALITTKGFRDLLATGNQSRPNIFDLSVSRPEVLFDQVVEVDERVTMKDHTEDPQAVKTIANGDDANLVIAITGETIRLLQVPDLAVVCSNLQQLWDDGFRSVAVVFIYSYAFPDHELLVGRLALEMGFFVTLSSEVQPMMNVVPRGTSAVADAYPTPIIKQYINSISANFRGGFGLLSPVSSLCSRMVVLLITANSAVSRLFCLVRLVVWWAMPRLLGTTRSVLLSASTWAVLPQTSLDMLACTTTSLRPPLPGFPFSPLSWTSIQLQRAAVPS